MPKDSTKIFLSLIFISTAGYIFLLRKNDRAPIEKGLASTKNADIFVHIAPSRKSDKLWKLNHKHWPVIVLETSKNWVKIIDAYNTTGWIQKGNISKPYALVLEETYAIKNYKDENSPKIAKILPNASVPFIEKVNEKYCKIKVKAQEGYVLCSHLFYQKN